jgi:hypothetical protein
LSNEFSVLVALAFILSIPLSDYFSGLWLDNFAYKTSTGPELFAVAGLIPLLLALLTGLPHHSRCAFQSGKGVAPRIGNSRC